jgi:hypothetical protein
VKISVQDRGSGDGGTGKEGRLIVTGMPGGAAMEGKNLVVAEKAAHTDLDPSGVDLSKKDGPVAAFAIKKTADAGLMSAAKQWKFIPGLKNGHSVASQLHLHTSLRR